MTNRKPAARKGKVQLIDASGMWQKMRKSLGSKRKELSDDHIATITRLFGDFQEASEVVVLDKDGQETSRQFVSKGQRKPAAPKGGTVKTSPISRIFKNEEFGYRTITVERPLRDEAGKVVVGQKGKTKGKQQADSALRDTENVPLSESVETYFKREVLPHAPDAWIDDEKTKVGYEIPFTRHFYVFEPPRSLEAIDADLRLCTDRIKELLETLG